MVGAPARTVNLDDAGATLRQIGLHLEDGAGFLIADEAGRVPDFYHRMEPLLRINARVTFAAKYANERTVRMVAAIVVAGSSLPSAVVRSPELSRRAVGWRLLQDAPSWDRDIDVSDARKDEQLRQHLDVITCSIWWQVEAVQHRGEWRDFCFSRLGATPVDQLDVVNDTSGRDRAIRLLYEEYRSAGSLELSKIQGWKDWLIALPDSAAGELLSGLVDFDADEKKRMAECSDLSQLPINAILGFTSPPLTLSVKYRSSKWLVKFCELGVMRGRALKRGELPAAREPDARDCEGASEEGEKENEP
jgi:hypothetical protein